MDGAHAKSLSTAWHAAPSGFVASCEQPNTALRNFVRCADKTETANQPRRGGDNTHLGDSRAVEDLPEDVQSRLVQNSADEINRRFAFRAFREQRVGLDEVSLLCTNPRMQYALLVDNRVQNERTGAHCVLPAGGVDFPKWAKGLAAELEAWARANGCSETPSMPERDSSEPCRQPICKAYEPKHVRESHGVRFRNARAPVGQNPCSDSEGHNRRLSEAEKAVEQK
jgi:hypothetical protein